MQNNYENKNPIRVLHVFAELNRGGAETMIMNIYRKIDRSQVQFDFVVNSESFGAYEDEILSYGGRVFRICKYRGINHINYIHQWKNLIAQHPEIQIVHGHVRSTAIFYLYICGKFGLKKISHSHSVASGSGLPGFIKDLLQIGIRYTADYFFACSKNAGEWLFGKKACASNRFYLLKNSINTEDFAYNEIVSKTIKRELSLENSLVLGHIGRFIPLKNHLFLLEIFAKLKIKIDNIFLLLIGEGETLPKIQHRVEELGLVESVNFMGSRSDVNKLLLAMDIFILPSTYEGLPVTLIEAQTSGLPCFVSDVITREVEITDLVHFISLNHSAEIWADEMYKTFKMKLMRFDRSNSVKQSGYDVLDNSIWLEDFYKTIIKGNSYA